MSCRVTYNFNLSFPLDMLLSIEESKGMKTSRRRCLLTDNQIKYVSYLENKRHNEATEQQTDSQIKETVRNNMANNAIASLNANTNWRNANTNERAQEIRNYEAVTNRYAAQQNVRLKDYQNYLTQQEILETVRHNKINEQEAHRSNVANENIKSQGNYINYLDYISQNQLRSSQSNLNTAKAVGQQIANTINKETVGAQIAYNTSLATEQIGKAKVSKTEGAIASAQLSSAPRLASINVNTKYQQYINEILQGDRIEAETSNAKARANKSKSGALRDIASTAKDIYSLFK